jgi:hypothetical protein
VLKSLSQWNNCVFAESRRCRMFNECLGCTSMRQGVPFIAPRDLEAVGVPFGRTWLPSVYGCTGLSGAHQTLNCARAENPWLATFCFWGHRIVRCATWLLLLADVAGSRCAASTPDCSTPHADHPVNCSRRRLEFPRAACWPADQLVAPMSPFTKIRRARSIFIQLVARSASPSPSASSCALTFRIGDL